MTNPTRDVFQLELEKRNVVQAEIDPVTGGIELSTAGKMAVSTRKTRIANSLSAAWAGKPAIDKAPWVAAPAWAGSTAYAMAGAIVQNGGNLYVLNTTGTSAASGGPSGTGVAPITDGTCKWYYAGPVIAAAGTPTPTLSYASASSASLTKSVPYNTASAFFYSGGTPTVKSGGYVFPSANRAPSAGNATSTYDALNPTVTFWSDAPKIALQGNSPYYNNTGLVVQVDGRFVQPGTLAPASTVNPGGLIIDWGGNRKMRKYRVTVQPNFVWYGVYVDAASIVVADKNPNRYRLVVNGDSLTAGSAGIPYLGRSWVDTFGEIVGCDDLYNCAVGGTGLINNAAGAATTFAQRLPDVIGFAPDVHILAGDYNDGSQAQADITAAALSYIQTFRATSNAYLLVFGTTAGSLGASSAQITKVEQALLDAVTQSGDSRTVFMPVSTDSPAWIDGTGNVGAASGSGNADAYMQPSGGAPHPVQGGVDYLAWRYAQAYAAWVRSLN